MTINEKSQHMVSNADSTAAEIVSSFCAAYNEQDFDAMLEFLATDLDFAHFNRGFSFTSSTELVGTLKTFATEYIPDRRLGDPIRTAVAGNVVYREQIWSGTLIADLPGFGSAGDKISDRLCSVFTVDDGKIVEYIDYG
jgi:limonene-1,2-epoxide hydrolase